MATLSDKIAKNSFSFFRIRNLSYLFFVIGICLFAKPASSQVITNYSYAASTGTYTALSGAISPSLTGGNADEGYINNLPIGFDFFYMGEYYTTVSASTNGWISLGTAIPDAEYTNNLNTAGTRPVIAPLWDDLDNATISYLTTGTSPNRVFTIQYANVVWNVGFLAPVSLNIQVKLTETTGRIAFVYEKTGFLGGGTNNPSASAGITGLTAGTYLSLNKITDNTATVSSSVETNTISNRPSGSAQTYTFTPPSGPSAPSGLTFSSVTSNSMTLNWTDNSSTETKFAIYRSTDNLTFTFYGFAAANATSFSTTTVSLLNASTTYYWRVYAISEGSIGSAVSNSQATLCGGPNTAQVSTSGLIGRYKLDGNASDDANINPGLFQNSPTPTTDRFGNANRAYSFNGVNQFMATTNTYTNPPDYSIAVWFKTSTTVGGRLVGFGDSRVGTSANHDRMIWMDDDGRINFCVNPGGVGTVISSPLNYNDNAWHQVIATSATGTGIKLYIDGVQVASNAASGGQSYTGYWKLAWESGGWNPASTSLFINASLDDFLIYNRAITSTEVTSSFSSPDGAGSNSPVCNGGTLNLTAPTIASATYSWTGPNGFTSSAQNPSVTAMNTAKEGTYTLVTTITGCATTTTSYVAAKINYSGGPVISQIPTAGLTSYFKLNGNAKDEQGTNAGAFQGSPFPTLAPDRFSIPNRAITLNGTTQFLSTSQNIASPGPTTYSLSLWFKTTTTSGGRLIGYGDSKTGTSGSRDRHIYMNNAGQILVGTGGLQYTSPVAYNDGFWHQIILSASTTAGIGTNIYIDGVNVYSLTTGAGLATGAAYAGYWKIGYDNLALWSSAPTSNYFNGTLDDILIYNATALTAAQALVLYKSPDGASNNSPVCVGSTFTLSAPTVASTTYSWSGPSGYTASAQNPTPTFISAYAGGVFTLSATSAGCTTNAYTIGIPNTTTPGTWVGYANTSWQNNDNWCGGVQPTASTNVIIPSVANLPTNSGTALANNITINTPATLTNTGAGTITVSANWMNTGTFIDNGTYLSGGYVSFAGGTAQTISGAGTNTFSNLIVNNANGLTLTSPATATVNGVLTLTTGVFTTNNNLTQNLYTGAIAGTGTGSTTGNIQFNKTIWGDRYHYISVPISSMTAADWNDDVIIKFASNSNLYSYNEALLDTNKKVGWAAIGSTAVALSPLKGYALYFPRFIYNTMLDVKGAYNHAATFSSGTLTNTPSTTPSFKPASDGWQLMGNPYPSNLDWDAPSGWTKTGLDNAIYTWDARTNRFVSYVAGVGTNGGSRYIGSMQGFFIKVTTSGGTGSLALNNNVRTTTSLRDVWRTASNEKIFRLKIANGTNEDETVVRFTDEASESFDSNLDAYKMLNDGEVPSLFSLSANADYSINSLPTTLVNKIIPLQLNVMADGDHVWNAELSGFEGGDSFFLEDRLTDTSYDLVENPVLNLTLTKGEQKGRFFIHYSKRESVVTENVDSKNTSGGIEISSNQQNVFLLFTDRNSGTADVVIFDAVGKKIYALEQTNINSGRLELNLPGINTGIYIVKVQTSASTKTQQVYIQK